MLPKNVIFPKQNPRLASFNKPKFNNAYWPEYPTSASVIIQALAIGPPAD